MTSQKHKGRVPGGEEARGDRRDRIVEAARRLLAEEGYDRLTMKQVAREAGVAQGLIHYYFSGKDEMLLEVLLKAAGRYGEEMRRFGGSLPEGESLAEAAEGESLAEAALARTRERVSREPERYRLRYELFALGLRKPELLAGVGELLDNGREGIGATIERIAERDRAPVSTGDARALAAVLLACFDGLALQKLADPERFDLEAAYGVLAKMAEGVIGSGRG